MNDEKTKNENWGLLRGEPTKTENGRSFRIPKRRGEGRAMKDENKRYKNIKLKNSELFWEFWNRKAMIYGPKIKVNVKNFIFELMIAFCRRL